MGSMLPYIAYMEPMGISPQLYPTDAGCNKGKTISTSGCQRNVFHWLRYLCFLQFSAKRLGRVSNVHGPS